MNGRIGIYQSESSLIDCISMILLSDDSPWRNLKLAYEFNYQGGRTDIIAVNNIGSVLAFEAKLTRWRFAVQQAYRNTAFSHYSYVVLPESSAKIALRFPEEFAKHSIGLCVASDDKLTTVIEAPSNYPLLPWLTDKATRVTLNHS